ncbi:MAG: A/G-specific adenine glycosylase [Thermoplasmata archaeon]|nr:A/G-specific adenine glycosylase [Thermoplasmata archaeon]
MTLADKNLGRGKRPSSKVHLGSLSARLLDWYRGNKRDFPWRETDNAYFVLIAEILLQRTKADQVRPVYDRFIKEYPSPSSLAKASEDEIRRVIEPLGLRKRGRLLKSLAGELVERYGGDIPEDPSALRELTGVGYYTSNAVMCFAHGMDVPIVDWNIARVFGRLTDYTLKRAPHTDKELMTFISQYIPNGRGRDFNLALLDFSASVCVPRNPRCGSCPLQTLCLKSIDQSQDGGG